MRKYTWTAVAIAVAAVLIAVVGLYRSAEPEGAYLPPIEVQNAAYDELRRLGCIRKADGTWNCPPGALD